jgi:hypothetical protein
VIADISVLLYAQCPTGKHPGSVRGTLDGIGRKRIPYPLQYDCGCEDPRDR